MCAQELRDAVTFRKEFDEEKYFAALNDTGIDEVFSRGTLSHETEVREGGSLSSGAQ